MCLGVSRGGGTESPVNDIHNDCYWIFDLSVFGGENPYAITRIYEY
jgi:hypothetical protein